MIIGSTALKYYFPDFKREPKDLDIIDKIQNYIINGSVKIERLTNPILIDYYNDRCPTYIGLNELYTLKISHSFWELENGSWDKHIFDIQFMKENGCKLIQSLFYDLYNYWNKIHGENKRSNLEMTSKDFFNNALKFPIPHDDLHYILIKHEYFNQKKPTFDKILKDGEEVAVDEQKFNLLTEKEKYNLVVEEVMCMAMERYNKDYYKTAFSKMLKKFIISHAPMWEALWIIQNHKELIRTIPFDFIEFFNKNIKYEKINS